MLPFLDALFAAIGVFVVVFALSVVEAQRDVHPPAGDVLVLARNGAPEITLLAGDGRTLFSGALYTEDATEDALGPPIAAENDRLDRPVRLVVAYDAASLDAGDRIRDALDALAVRSPSETDAPEDEPGAIAFQIRWVPLASGSSTELAALAATYLRADSVVGDREAGDP